MTPSTHCPLIHIHESELADYYEIGWHYCGQSPTKPDFVVIEWQLKRAPVMPFKEVVSHRVPETLNDENAHERAGA